MKILLLFLLVILLQREVFAQAGEWTWIKGDSGNSVSAIYGIQGMPDSANHPPGFYEPCEWRDSNGNFWLYGGSNINGVFSNLWKYNPSLNEWTWINGPGNIANENPIYGTKGIPSVNNTPGARSWCILTWVDVFNNLWLFGGHNLSNNGFADLWKYNIASNEWTWMQGSNMLEQSGVYGTQGLAEQANYPGSRSETNATWTDIANNLWLFGGYGYNESNNLGYLNDLWKYNIDSNEWTWMRGAKNVNDVGSYGTKGITDTVSNPPARGAYTKWKDLTGNFWIYGGAGYFGSVKFYNDVWMYNPLSNKWTWMSGTNLVNNSGNVDSLCVSSVDLIGPARFENRACWSDSCVRFWTFGGRKLNGEDYNDLWNFDSQTLKWTMISGSVNINQVGSYGTKGLSNSTNQPSSRSGSVAWVDLNKKLWLFGGTDGVNVYNDLWSYSIDLSCSGLPSCLTPTSNFAGVDTKLCEKFCTNFFDQSTNNPTAWQWDFPGGDPSSSTDQNPVSICYATPGVYDVTLITTNAYGNDTLTLPGYIIVFATPAPPTISLNGNVLTSSPAFDYQWQLNSIDISGATLQSYTYTLTGLYTVIAGDSNGCTNYASLLITAVEDMSIDFSVSIFPNPSDGILNLELFNLSAGSNMTSIEVVNTLGQKVFSSKAIQASASQQQEINLTHSPDGVYFLQIKSGEKFYRKKFVLCRE